MIKNKKILSVVIARKGSKGLPGKNYKILMDKPLVEWSILASYNSKYIDVTVVSSNCPEVKKVYLNILINLYKKSKKVLKKLYWVDRPDEYATPTSINEEAVIHAYETMKEFINFDPDMIVHLQPTSPCRSDNLLDKCVEKYYKGNYDSLLTGKKDTPFIWQLINGKWKYTVDKNGCCNRKMRQDFLDEEGKNSDFIWHDDGSVYISDKNMLINTNCRIGKSPCLFTLEGLSSIQIDTEFDFQLIEQIAKLKNLKSLI